MSQTISTLPSSGLADANRRLVLSPSIVLSPSLIVSPSLVVPPLLVVVRCSSFWPYFHHPSQLNRLFVSWVVTLALLTAVLFPCQPSPCSRLNLPLHPPQTNKKCLLPQPLPHLSPSLSTCLVPPKRSPPHPSSPPIPPQPPSPATPKSRHAASAAQRPLRRAPPLH